MDPGKCESFCLSSGFQVIFISYQRFLKSVFIFQGSVGSCNCGYIMFSKRSGLGHALHQDKEMDNTNQELLHHLKGRSITDFSPGPVFAQLSTKKIVEALDILDRVNNSQNDDYLRDLSEKEVENRK